MGYTDVFFLTFISLLGMLLIYLFIRNQVAVMIDQKMKVLYKEKIASDVQNIYRELDNYSSILDSRIGRLKNLTERHESSLKLWENIQKELRKSKTGKELLNYMEEQKLQSPQNPQYLADLKKEITDEIKLFVSKKLNIVPDTVQRTSPPKSIDYSREKTRSPVEDVNIAELIIQEMGEEAVLKKTRQPPARQIESFKLPKRPQMDQTPDNSGGFLKILGAVGKTLSPLFLKSASPFLDSQVNSASKIPEKIFNDLIKKEMKQTESLPPLHADAPEPVKTGFPAQKTMEPEELVRLLEELRNSKGRPEALKKLMRQGFQLNQIADISNIPFSDLELTKNLYNLSSEGTP
ncbi:MAG: hypothetical protein OEV66_00110 [Spirochaetia bacterium]|nr:hypothetical protein [Spirochaetia bacterium]